MAKQLWVVRAGKDAAFLDDFLSRKMVAIGWGTIGSMEKVKSRDQVVDLLKEFFPEYTKIQRAVNGGQLYRFRKDLVETEDVITYDPNQRVYHAGKIIGAYQFDQSAHEELRHQRQVVWTGVVERDGLSVATKNSLGSIATIFCVSAAAAEEIRSKLSGANESALEARTAALNQVESVTDEIKDEATLREDTEEKALSFLQDRLSLLDPFAMQELVAGLLRAMGYKTQVSPIGPDRGRDVLASPDGFGFQTPRIVVEVKHRRGAMGSQELRSFLAGLRNGDNGLYVSTGGFSREAKYEAERANHHIALMNSTDLAKAIVDYYDRMDAESRVLLPLKKIYWPA